ncbi:transport and Golgi organization 2 homolog [Rhodamnia argentea]|uniref:Transport and Golgi organization 2 homolog n=1 Tax=Rhodamnia argentea TaxID=178133 RepID=A0A8B8ND86_9MYRT|nr:transport and Golgi organization 2 homolog [Rhodamnia argentea]
MCIAAFVWQAHPLYPLILLQNRDEYHNRPTKPVGWWEEIEILGGRDELAGGTWLACSREGRVAFLTNVLELHTLHEAKSRGDLPVLFLESTKSPREFAEQLATEAHQYNGFNLIVADTCSKTMVYISNRPQGEPITIQEVSPGIHVLSNAKLDSPWHKAQRLEQNFRELLNKYGEFDLPVKEMVEKLMEDTVKADKSSLPHICSPDWEFNLSSIYVEVDTPLGRYGTRSTAVLSVRANGEVSLYEKYLEKDQWKEKTVKYHIKKMKKTEGQKSTPQN